MGKKKRPVPKAVKKHNAEPWYMKIDTALSEIASISRATAKFIISVVFLVGAAAVLYILFKAGLYYWESTPGWVKWIMKVVGR